MPIAQILLDSTGGASVPTYTLTAAANNVNEGSALTFNITTTGVEDGTTLWWGSWNNFDGVGRMDNPSGSTTITSNAGSFSITVATDSTTAGSEQQYNVFLYTGSQGGTLVASVSGIVVNDTSQSPTYTLSLGGGNSVNEGSNQTLNVGGTNVPGGTYYWTIETHSEDFATTSGSVEVTGGTGGILGSFTVTPTADFTTEGSETFTVALRSGSITGTILATSQAANITDTSLTP